MRRIVLASVLVALVAEGRASAETTIESIGWQCPMRCLQTKSGRFLDVNPQVCSDHWLQPFGCRWWYHIRERRDEPKGSCNLPGRRRT